MRAREGDGSPSPDAETQVRRSTRIYLAGPEVFLPDAIPVGERKKALCLQYGFEGVFPLDNVVDLTARPPRETGIHIGQLNEQLIRSCDIVIANTTPRAHRGCRHDVRNGIRRRARAHRVRVQQYKLMLESCIEGTGGVFVSYDAPSGEVLRGMEGFEWCLRHSKWGRIQAGPTAPRP